MLRGECDDDELVAVAGLDSVVEWRVEDEYGCCQKEVGARIGRWGANAFVLTVSIPINSDVERFVILSFSSFLCPLPSEDKGYHT